MAGIKQVIEFAREEIVNILIEKANDLVAEAAGKKMQGKSVCEFKVVQSGPNDGLGILQSATVVFERAGK